MSYIIESNIPVPTGNGRGRGKGDLRKTIEKMQVNQSIVITSKSLRNQTQRIAKAIGITIVTRKIEKTETIRVWRVK